jgi:hypothetical protein
MVQEDVDDELDHSSYAASLLEKSLIELRSERKKIEDSKVPALFHMNAKNVLFSQVFGGPNPPQLAGIYLVKHTVLFVLQTL